MSKQLLFRQQHLNATLEEVWNFFSNPVNLADITPGDMEFRILTPNLPDEIYDGLEIAYRVRPILSVPMKWRSRIVSVDPYHYFTDIQLQGPYKSWEHTHVFEETNEGVLMTDHVRYEVPAGIIGSTILGDLIAQRLDHIFDYRFDVIRELFKSEEHARLVA